MVSKHRQYGKKTVDRCIPCQAIGKQKSQEPLAMTDMPTGPWETVHLEFYGPLPSGEYLLVAIDRYSRFPEVEIVKSPKASVVIPKLEKIFVTHGIPSIVKTDNGSHFNGEEYSRYLKALGIKPQFSTPFGRKGMPKRKDLCNYLVKHFEHQELKIVRGSKS